MENHPENTISCSKCNAPVEADDHYCSECGYPERGTDNEKSRFIAAHILTRNQRRENKKSIRSGGNTLFFLAGLMFLAGIYTAYIQHGNLDVFITNSVLAIIYLGLALWIKHRPFMALLLALLLFLTVIFIAAVADPTSLSRGVIFKVVIVFFLGKALYSSREYRKSN
ncbi:zinc ribbon domain-containing protein [Ascidiimonas aurantiaca]|uniref:zinc ribbon domain-containing protein n=1 Tax=Ascidiimonas aurantiaca TaxID=1685432 RepID=UPI0030EE93F7